MRLIDRLSHEWESQVVQYPSCGPDGVSYFRGELNDTQWVDCLLYREGGAVVGILNHYPTDLPPERKGNFTVMIREDHKGRGIASRLLLEALMTWDDIDLADQTYTTDGHAFMGRFLRRFGGKAVSLDDAPIAPIRA